MTCSGSVLMYIVYEWRCVYSSGLPRAMRTYDPEGLGMTEKQENSKTKLHALLEDSMYESTYCKYVHAQDGKF